MDAQVVFCNGARALDAEGDTAAEGKSQKFELFFGAADAVVGTATVEQTLTY